MPHAILSAIGADRPGLVDEVSEFVFSRGGNIEDSRMVNLRGQFAMMVLLGGGADVIDRLRRGLGELSQKTALHAELHPAQEAVAPPAHALPFVLKGTGIDQPGLVHKLAHLLRDLQINIESLDSRLRPAPYTGAPLFEMELVLAVPRTTSLTQLRENVARLCDQMNIDWELDPL